MFCMDCIGLGNRSLTCWPCCCWHYGRCCGRFSGSYIQIIVELLGHLQQHHIEIECGFGICNRNTSARIYGGNSCCRSSSSSSSDCGLTSTSIGDSACCRRRAFVGVALIGVERVFVCVVVAAAGSTMLRLVLLVLLAFRWHGVVVVVVIDSTIARFLLGRCRGDDLLHALLPANEDDVVFLLVRRSAVDDTKLLSSTLVVVPNNASTRRYPVIGALRTRTHSSQCARERQAGCKNIRGAARSVRVLRLRCVITMGVRKRIYTHDVCARFREWTRTT